MEYRRGQRKRTGVSVFVGTDETTNATGSVLELWVTRSYYKIKNICFSNDFRIDPQFLHLWISYALFKWKDFQLIFFSCFFIWFSYVCDMVLTCFSPVSFFDVFHVTCFINFIISLSGQYFKQLSPYFCRHSESASKGKVVLATAPKQHCNVEWCPPDSPPKGAKDYWHTKIYVCFFWCELLCVRCWNSHVVRKWLQYPTLMPWCGTLFFFFSRGVCRRCWRGQVLMDRLIKGRVFYLYKWFATMDQPKKTRHVINDIQHASICLMAGLQIIPRDGSASRPKSLDGVGIVYSSCGVDTVSNFNLCIMCMYIYILCYIILGWSRI